MMQNLFESYIYCGEFLSEEASLKEHTELAKKARNCLEVLYNDLEKLTGEETEEYIQSLFYEAGKIHFKDNLRLWFSIVYWIILKEKTGPRMGTFTKLVGVDFILNRIHKSFFSPFF